MSLQVSKDSFNSESVLKNEDIPEHWTPSLMSGSEQLGPRPLELLFYRELQTLAAG